MSAKPTNDELTNRLHSPGWRLVDESPNSSVNGTLGELLTESHSRKSKGHSKWKIQEIETRIELELFQIEQLWQHLGLPTI
jgi:hypothetical protein